MVYRLLKRIISNRQSQCERTEKGPTHRGVLYEQDLEYFNQKK